MVRSMYSGVSGLRTHQTRMDTIGNNIANVNTYGFKSARTTFRDIYYQSMTSASAPTAAAGGMNPSAVGYGSKVGSVDLMMGRSTFTMTDQSMDMAIDGEGFFQVQDGAGNVYYTRAGMLNFDSQGNLVDMQGNYVLGVNGDPTGRGPASERISVTLPDVSPTPASVSATINGKQFTISTSKPSIDGNLNMTFSVDSSIPDGEMMASMSSTGIIIKMNPDNIYNDWGEFNRKINEAITTANNNTEHPAGLFTVSYSGTEADPFSGPMKASELTSTNYGIISGSANFTGKNFFGGVYPTGVGNAFTGTGAMDNYNCTYVTGTSNQWKVSVEVNGVVYSGTVDENRTSAGEFFLRNETPGAEANDYIICRRPSFAEMTAAWQREVGDGAKAGFAIDAPTGAYINSGTVNVAGMAGIDVSTATSWKGEADLIAAALNAGAAANPATSDYTATVDAAGNITLTAVAVGTKAQPATTFGTVDASKNNLGANPQTLVGGSGFPPVDAAAMGNPTATASRPSPNLGLSGTAFALRGGTAGGPQTIADMTGIAIAPNGIITGWDSQGVEMTIGRIDIATFANPSGLNQSGSSNYTVSANSGVPQLSIPGSEGAGKLVGGSLELSNVDLSREFSDMITTQRGYQANSRIITVSDTMLEELINLKR